MVETISVYDIENYIPYSEDEGIYDTLSNDFIKDLRLLPVWREVPQKNRLLDEISKELYETELLWWVLQWYNNILDPLEESTKGIQAPELSEIENLLIKYKTLNAQG